MAGELQTVLSEKDPWFARNSGKLVMAFAIVLLLAVLGVVPSPVSEGVKQMQNEHASMAKTLVIQCVHDAADERERGECITGTVSPR